MVRDAFIYCLSKKIECCLFRLSARLLDQVIAQNTLNQEYVDLRLWQAELYVKGGSYDQKSSPSQDDEGIQNSGKEEE